MGLLLLEMLWHLQCGQETIPPAAQHVPMRSATPDSEHEPCAVVFAGAVCFGLRSLLCFSLSWVAQSSVGRNNSKHRRRARSSLRQDLVEEAAGTEAELG